LKPQANSGLRIPILGYWNSDSLRARFARGAIWSFIGTAISQGLSLIASIITARMLGRVGFGQLGIINSTVGMFGIFAGLGLGLTTTKYVAELRTANPDRAGTIIGLSSLVSVASGGLITLLLIIFAPIVASRSFHAPYLVMELRVGSLLLFLNALNGVQTGTMAGFEAFRAIAKANLARGVLSFPVLIGGAYFGHLRGAVWALVGAAAIGWIINHMILVRKCRSAGMRVRYHRSWTEARVLWSFSLPAVLANAVAGPVTWIAGTMLVRTPNGYAEMGIFNAATQWRTAIMFFPALIGEVVLPMLSSLHGERRRESARKVMMAAIGINAMCALPFFLVVVLFRGQIMALFGASFSSRGTVLWLTALTSLLLAIQLPVAHVIAASGRMWLGAAMNFGWAATLLGSCWYFLTLGWGADGVAGGYVIAYLVHATWTFGFAAWLLGRRQEIHLTAANSMTITEGSC
jgi:O-antigen/teichoic acid export membrane protein